MTPEKIVSVIEMYKQRLEAEHIPAKRIDTNRSFKNCTTREILSHAHYLCEGVCRYAMDPEKFGKANRHLTAIQMCLGFAGWYTLAELMDHNRDR